jgi:hypothetical protein
LAVAEQATQRVASALPKPRAMAPTPVADASLSV